jgi:hypothetical protein
MALGWVGLFLADSGVNRADINFMKIHLGAQQRDAGYLAEAYF